MPLGEAQQECCKGQHGEPVRHAPPAAEPTAGQGRPPSAEPPSHPQQAQQCSPSSPASTEQQQQQQPARQAGPAEPTPPSSTPRRGGGLYEALKQQQPAEVQERLELEEAYWDPQALAERRQELQRRLAGGAGRGRAWWVLRW